MTSSTRFPATVEDLTPAWLTSALRSAGAIAGDSWVEAVEPEAIAEGVGFLSHLFRLHLTVAGAGPSTLVAKLPTSSEYLELARMVGAYAREVAFYALVAPHCPMRTPVSYVADIDETTGDFILLMEDLSRLENGDHLAGVSFERAEQVIDELVKLHAWAWDLDAEPARHPAFESIDSPLMIGVYTAGVPQGWQAYHPHARVEPPQGLAEVIDEWAARFPAMASALSRPTTLVNGDLRVDNLFFDTTGKAPTTVDFQLVMRGAGIWDVAYLVGQGMSPAERSGRERDLVQRYVDSLQAAGIDYGREQAWRQFRTAVVAQLTMPLTAATSWNTLNDRAKELLHALNERAFAIIADTDALAHLPS
jgi:aminoglycoside phosphotransferase (APT) family kinase protein